MSDSSPHMNPATGLRFTGIWLPMVTPMRNGEVDTDAAVQLAEHYQRAGISGLVLFGSTGEGNLLSTAEKIAMVQAIQASLTRPADRARCGRRRHAQNLR